MAVVALLGPGLPARLEGQYRGAPDTLLARLTAEALAASPALRSQAAAARAALSRVRPAGALPDPMLTLGVMDLTLPRFAFRRSDFTEVDVEVAQEFPWPGTRAARTQSAKAMAQAAAATLESGQREVRVRTAALYYRLRYLLAARATLQRQRSLLAGSVDISTARYATGGAPQTEPLQARVALARLDAEEAGLEEEAAAVRADLAALRNRPQSESLPAAPLDPLELPHQPRPADLADLSALLAAHPRLAARQAAVEGAEQAARAERLGGRPDFTIMTRYGARPLGSDFFSAFVGVRMPLWSGRKQHRLADAARAEAAGARAALDEERARLEAEAATTLARVRASQHRIALLLDRVLPAAREAVEATLRGYRVGQVDFLTLLAVEDGLYRTELEVAGLTSEHLTRLVVLEQLISRETDHE